MKTFFKSIGFKVLCGIVAFLLGLMIYAGASGGLASLPAAVSGALLTPLQTAFTAVGDWVSGLFTFGNAELEAEIEALNKEVAALREQQVELDELRRKNELYAQFLELKEQHPEYQFVDASVIASDPSDPYNNFTIGRGSVSGVKPGNTVITPLGLAGVVTEVGPNYAKVRSLLDPDLQVSAYDSRTREDGLLTGNVELALDGKLKLSHMDRHITASAGDIVVTYGGSYPEGLMIGTITDIGSESDGLSKYAVIKPFVDVGTVSEVFVIVNYEDPTAGAKK
ncbi:MAG: rod shape-determining protein MreC [Clostridia bacterium]|nr:rod shape-determining protein MreC [Clostridia bacterium]